MDGFTDNVRTRDGPLVPEGKGHNPTLDLQIAEFRQRCKEMMLSWRRSVNDLGARTSYDGDSPSFGRDNTSSTSDGDHNLTTTTQQLQQSQAMSNLQKNLHQQQQMPTSTARPDSLAPRPDGA
jgi:hypothetical protein